MLLSFSSLRQACFALSNKAFVQKLELKIERSTQVGTVVVMCWDDIPEEGDLRRLLTGNPTKLESQFRLTYSMILNLLRVEDLKVHICCVVQQGHTATLDMLFLAERFVIEFH